MTLDTTYPPNGGLADCRGIILQLQISTQPILAFEDWLIVEESMNLTLVFNFLAYPIYMKLQRERYLL